MKRQIIGLSLATGLSLGAAGCPEDGPVAQDQDAVQSTSNDGGGSKTADETAGGQDASKPVAVPAPKDDAPLAPPASAGSTDAGFDSHEAGNIASSSAADAGGVVVVSLGDASAGQSQPPSAVEQQVLDLIELGMKMSVPSTMLMPLYKQLEPVTIEFMTSQWHGSLFSGTPQGQAGWWGKNMKDPKDVQPMIYQREDGSVYPNESYGRAALSIVAWNGLSPSVLLKYKTLGITDYFRRVTDDTVLGLTPGTLGSDDFFFRLSRDNTTVIGK